MLKYHDQSSSKIFYLNTEKNNLPYTCTMISNVTCLSVYEKANYLYGMAQEFLRFVLTLTTVFPFEYVSMIKFPN